jgi:hypothetical protein
MERTPAKTPSDQPSYGFLSLSRSTRPPDRGQYWMTSSARQALPVDLRGTTAPGGIMTGSEI